MSSKTAEKIPMNCEHYVPGRLHLVCEPLKENEALAQTLQDAIAQIKGVRSAEARPLTGSVIIEFDHFETCPAGIIRSLARRGHAVAVTPPARQPTAEGAAETVGEKVAETVVEKAAETVVEKAAEATLGETAGAVIGAIL